MLKGDAVWNLTVMFLHIWNALRPTDTSFDCFRPHTYRKQEYGSDGFVQPYGDSPLDFENVGENVYLNIMLLFIDIFIRQVNPARKTHIPVNHKDFAVVAVIHDNGYKRHKGIERLTFYPILLHRCIVALRKKASARMCI